MVHPNVGNVSAELAELDYGQKQALLFGGEQPPYTINLPDGSLVHECGKGIGGLYRAIRALSWPDLPKAGQMSAMLETHRANEEYMVKYIRHQVEQYAPEGSRLRADLLSIVDSEAAPAERVQRFMDYMDVLMAVVEPQRETSGNAFLLLKLRSTMDLYTGNPDIKRLGSFLSAIDYIRKIHARGLLGVAQLAEYIEKWAPLGGLAKYSISADIAADLSENASEEIRHNAILV